VRRVASVSAVVLVVVFTTVALLLRDTPTGAYFQRSDQVAMIGIGLLGAIGVLLFTRPLLVTGAEGVWVRNVLGTQEIPWSLIREISFPDGVPWARLELPDDEYIPVMAIQAADGRYAAESITELRRLHAEATRY
jgi:hypothetical protein